MPAIVQLDPERVVTEAVRAVRDAGHLPAPPVGTAWKYGTEVAPGVTPSWFVQVRHVGGTSEQVVAERPLVDIRVWTDGALPTKGICSQAARVLVARLRQRVNLSVVMIPTSLPDPADPSKHHHMFTIQLLTRGVQS